MRHLKVVRRTEEVLPPTGSGSLLPHPPALSRRDLLSVHDLISTEVDFLLKLALRLKAHPGRYQHTLEGKTLASPASAPA